MKNQFLKIFLDFKRRRKKKRKSFLQEAPSKTVIDLLQTDQGAPSDMKLTRSDAIRLIERSACLNGALMSPIHMSIYTLSSSH